MRFFENYLYNMIAATDTENYWKSPEWEQWIANNGIYKIGNSEFYDKHGNFICNLRKELYQYYLYKQAWHWTTAMRSGPDVPFPG